MTYRDEFDPEEWAERTKLTITVTRPSKLADGGLPLRALLRALIDNLDTVQADEDDLSAIRSGGFDKQPLYTEVGKALPGTDWTIREAE